MTKQHDRPVEQAESVPTTPTATRAADLERRLARLILDGEEFTADDLTDAGRLALDADHAPNAGQNGIGSFVQTASRRGLISFTGRVVRSLAEHRKGGSIRVWTGTESGRLWARNVR